MLKFIEAHSLKILLFIPLLSLAMHFHVFKLELIGIHVWRQTQTQTVINNYIREDNQILNPKYNENPETDRIMRMEFPLMQWVFAQVSRVFGHEVIVSRVLTFIIGIFSVFGIYFLILNLTGRKAMAVIGAWCFNFSPVFYYYTVNPLPDNFALCCSIWSMGFFFKAIKKQSPIPVISSAIFLCLASLVKLPFIVYGAAIGVYLILELKENFKENLRPVLIIIGIYAITLLPALLWYIIVIPTWGGNGIVAGILDLRMGAAEIYEILFANLISTLPELLLNYAALPFFIAGLYFMFRNKIMSSKIFPVLLAWGIAVLFYFFFELNMIAAVHDYYLFPFLPLLFIIVSYGVWAILQLQGKAFKYIVMFLLVLLPITAYLRINTRWNTESPGLNVDFYNNKTELRNLVNADDRVIVGFDKSHFILLYYLDKKGWAFDEGFTVAQFNHAIQNDAKYLFTDTPIDTIPEVKMHLGEKIYDKGTIRVFKLVP